MARYFLFLVIVSLGLEVHGNTVETEEKNTLGHSLAVCYLQNIKKNHNDTMYKNYTIEEKIFGKGSGPSRAPLHDVTLSIIREKSKDTDQVILTAQVFGSPEEFEGHNVLEGEKALVKYRILYSYLAHQAKMNARYFTGLRSNSMMDSTTQIISPPTNHSEMMFMNPFERRVYTDKYVMTIVIKFTAPEFDALIQQHFVNNTN